MVQFCVTTICLGTSAVVIYCKANYDSSDSSVNGSFAALPDKLTAGS